MNTKIPKIIDWDSLSGCYSSLLVLDANFTDVLTHAQSKLVYLATPYSKEVLDQRGQWSAVRSEALGHEAATWAGHLAMNNVCAVSPIIQSVCMTSADAADNIDPLDAVFWEKWCRPLLFKSDMLVIPPIKGWGCSMGVWHEAWMALRYNMPVMQIKARTEFGGVL